MTIRINADAQGFAPSCAQLLATPSAIPQTAGMKRFAYRSLVWLTASAFIVGNALSHPCATVHASVPQARHVAAHAEHHQASQAAHHHAAQDEVADGTSPATDHHACPTCCGLCALASTTPSPPRFAVTLAMSRVVFKIATERLTDWRAVLDPDIPKSLA